MFLQDDLGYIKKNRILQGFRLMKKDCIKNQWCFWNLF